MGPVSSNPPMIQELPAEAPPPGLETSEPVSAPPPTEVPQQPDEVALGAVELARAAVVELAEPGTVGEHLGAAGEPGGLTVHPFAASAKGYRGWHWAVSLAHVPGYDPTVCDIVLLPGPGSILGPAWVPWSERLAPGDLGPGDELPYLPDDPLLVPGYTVTDEEEADQQLFWELGLGRERVIGREGLTEAAQRWERGPHGPTAETAIQAAAPCLTCGYFVSVSGPLRQHFGVCANEWSPADGTVVTMDFGCGAHSETDLELPAPEPLAAHILDEMIIEHVTVDRSGNTTEIDDKVARAAHDAAPDEVPPAP
jgi:hypothetical protein